MSIRCFIAVELDEEIKRELAKLQDRLGRALGSDESMIKWVRPENIHLTLKFLGEVDDKLLPDICAAVSEAAGTFGAFDFEVGNCGCFGSGGSARILWVGITGGNEKLAALAKAVDDNLGVLDFPPERRKFSAHLTLARIRNVKVGRAVREVVDKLDGFTLGSQDVTELTVFQSELRRSGPIYTAVHHGPLSEHKK